MRLAPEENASATLVGNTNDLRGHWDGDGHYVASDPDAHDREWRVEARGMGRIGRSFQYGVIVPWLHTIRRTRDSSSSGGGVGDVSLLGRWDFVKVGGEGDLPGIAFTMSVGLPTGRSPYKSTDTALADVTGSGAWEFRPGIAIEKSWWTGWYVLAAAGLGFYAPFRGRDDVKIQLGPRELVFVAAGKSWTNGLGLAVGASLDRESGPRVDGQRYVAFRARTSALLFGSYEIDDHWQLTASSQWDLPVSGLGRDQLAGLTFGLGIRRAWNVY